MKTHQVKSSRLFQAEQKTASNLRDLIELELETQRRLTIKSLHAFIRTFWKVIEPATPFVDGWHIAAICAHLEAVSRFEISKLVINMPPRHMKSILCSVMFPAWVWLQNPERRFIYCSYAEPLATRDSVKTRTLIEHEDYQTLVRWKAEREGKEPWYLKTDQNQKKLFENSATGVRMSVGVGGGLTGQGGDFLFVDDPLNALEVNSDVALEEVNNWHDTAFASRYNNPQRHAKVIIMQRLHENDLSGHVLKKDRYEKLILPARYRVDSEIVSRTSLGYVDPRKTEGELLWPERFTDQAITDLEDDLNNFNDSGDAQLQQDPRPISGGLFPRGIWKYFDAPPSTILDLVMFIDAAQKPGISNDFTVISTWAKTENGYFVLDVWREKTDAPLLEEMTIQKYNQWKPSAVVIEDKSAGSSLIQYLLKKTQIPVLPYNPTVDKVTRATMSKGTLKAGKVFLPVHAEWLKNFISEHEKFPKGKNDDQVDVTSMAVDYFQRNDDSGPRIRSLT